VESKSGMAISYRPVFVAVCPTVEKVPAKNRGITRVIKGRGRDIAESRSPSQKRQKHVPYISTGSCTTEGLLEKEGTLLDSEHLKASHVLLALQRSEVGHYSKSSNGKESTSLAFRLRAQLPRKHKVFKPTCRQNFPWKVGAAEGRPQLEK